MTQMSARRRALKYSLGRVPQRPAGAPVISGYPIRKRVIAGLLGVRLPERSSSPGENQAGAAIADVGVLPGVDIHPGQPPSSSPVDVASAAQPTREEQDAVSVLRRLAAGLAARLPLPTEYAEGLTALSITPAAGGSSDLEVRLHAPAALIAALASTPFLLSFRPGDSQGTGDAGEVVLLGRFDNAGIARFRVPGNGAILGLRVPSHRRLRFIELPELIRHAPAAATEDSEIWLRQRAVLATPPLTVTAYEAPDEKMHISVEGLAKPDPDTGLLVTCQISGGPVSSWVLLLRWSAALGAVSASLTIGQARAGLTWALDPVPVRLADLPADILQRSQAVADRESSKRIAEILASRR
jgi:hypothetical protein